METLTVTKRGNFDQANHMAYTALKIGFVLAPIIAGFDKFFNLLTDWTKYLAPVIPDTFNVTPSTFMMIVGAIEIIAGLGVLFKPKVFSFVVCAWLVGIILNLIIQGHYLDVALRDVGLALGAFALGELATNYERTRTKVDQTPGINRHQPVT